MSVPAKNKFDPNWSYFDRDGKPTQTGREYFTKLDALIAALAAGNLPTLVNAANDAAAAAAGVAIGQIYRNVNALQVRLV